MKCWIYLIIGAVTIITSGCDRIDNDSHESVIIARNMFNIPEDGELITKSKDFCEFNFYLSATEATKWIYELRYPDKVKPLMDFDEFSNDVKAVVAYKNGAKIFETEGNVGTLDDINYENKNYRVEILAIPENESMWKIRFTLLIWSSSMPIDK